jgi:menaquinone-specific isochorismate synthase
MRSAIAFLQTGPDLAACAVSPLAPLWSPLPGRPAFFAPLFAHGQGEPAWLDVDPAALVVLSRADWRRRFLPPSPPPARPAWGPPDRLRFARAFESLVKRLDAGTLRKGVPVTMISAEVDPASAAALFDGLLSRVPDLPASVTAYGFYRPPAGGDTGEFLIGATPELLFDLDASGRLQTMAVAGTRRVGGGPGDLAARPKDRDEHQVVVDDLVEQLGAWGRPAVTETSVRRFGDLEHLVAGISVQAERPIDFEAAARRLHPTPALGVHPRGPAGCDWLREIDPLGERRRFGAPFGLRWPSGAGRAVVAIRGVQYGGGRLQIWAGCGVVRQSRLADEWQEVMDKMAAVRAMWDV